MVLFTALAAVPYVHALGGLQHTSASSQLRQARPDDSFTVENAVVIGEASAEEQAAFHRDTSAAAGSTLRKLLHGSHRGAALFRYPRCPRCRFPSCKSKSKGKCTRIGHCLGPRKGQRARPRLFRCKSAAEAETSQNSKKESSKKESKEDV